jgi:hypothetical protein
LSRFLCISPEARREASTGRVGQALAPSLELMQRVGPAQASGKANPIVLCCRQTGKIIERYISSCLEWGHFVEAPRITSKQQAGLGKFLPVPIAHDWHGRARTGPPPRLGLHGGGQHSGRRMAGAATGSTAVEKCHLGTALREPPANSKPDDAGPDDGYLDCHALSDEASSAAPYVGMTQTEVPDTRGIKGLRWQPECLRHIELKWAFGHGGNPVEDLHSKECRQVHPLTHRCMPIEGSYRHGHRQGLCRQGQSRRGARRGRRRSAR